MTRSSTKFISIGVWFSLKVFLTRFAASVLRPVQQCVRATCMCERGALFSFHYGRFTRFQIFVITDVLIHYGIGLFGFHCISLYVTKTLLEKVKRLLRFLSRQVNKFLALPKYLAYFSTATVYFYQKIVISWSSRRVVVLGSYGQRAGSPGVRAGGRATRIKVRCLSLARFFAAPECGNAAAGGAAEIATRHPPATMHLETHRFVLQYETRCV